MKVAAAFESCWGSKTENLPTKTANEIDFIKFFSKDKYKSNTLKDITRKAKLYSFKKTYRNTFLQRLMKIFNNTSHHQISTWFHYFFIKLCYFWTGMPSFA